MRPQTGDYMPYFETYISLVKGDAVLTELENNHKTTQEFLKSLKEEVGNLSYAPGKWSVKQVLLHLSDCERVFSYRALSIARKDTSALPGFNENIWAENCHPEKRTLNEIGKELSLVRQNTISLFKSFDLETFHNKGISNNNPITVLAIAYIIAGHEIHHLNVLKEKYLL